MKKAVYSPWLGRKVLITAGPTQEPMDPIRFLTNASSGAMGFALAQAARDQGAKVTVVSGPCEFTNSERKKQSSSRGIQIFSVVTAAEMYRKVLSNCRRADVIIAAAAVGDWKFKAVSIKKIKKTDRPMQVTLLPNPDIIADVSRLLRSKNGHSSVLVGFALETDNRLASARSKMKQKGLDLIVANGPDSLGLDRAHVTIINRCGAVHPLPAMSKSRAAKEILKHVEVFL